MPTVGRKTLLQTETSLPSSTLSYAVTEIRPIPEFSNELARTYQSFSKSTARHDGSKKERRTTRLSDQQIQTAVADPWKTAVTVHDGRRETTLRPTRVDRVRSTGAS